jgi:hypothetical protein
MHRKVPPYQPMNLGALQVQAVTLYPNEFLDSLIHHQDSLLVHVRMPISAFVLFHVFCFPSDRIAKKHQMTIIMHHDLRRFDRRISVRSRRTLVGGLKLKKQRGFSFFNSASRTSSFLKICKTRTFFSRALYNDRPLLPPLYTDDNRRSQWQQKKLSPNWRMKSKL